MPTIPASRRSLPAILSVLFTLALWLGCKWWRQDWFEDPYKYPAKAASLAATVLMCWCVALSTRWRPLEGLFGGLDQVYQVHKRLGRWSFWLIIWHPLFLAAHQLPNLAGFAGYLWFEDSRGDAYLLGQNIGLAAFMLMAYLIAATLWIRLPYHVWKRSHEWFGLVLLTVLAHVWLVDADVAAYAPLRWWMWGLLILVAACFVYIRFLYRFLGPRHEYVVSRLDRHADVLMPTLAPLDGKMDFKPSQFVYLVVRKPGITPEPHPYSIASGYGLEAEFKLGIKQVGDHTRSLSALEVGDRVNVYGPYGRFSDRFLAAERDCVFMGGGIGITPFIGMWHVALHSEERLDPEGVPERLRRMHPEIIRTWRSPRVALFYVCRDPEDAGFHEDIEREVEQSRSKGFAALEERGHHYELYLSSRQGRVTAEYIAGRVPGGIEGKDIYFCGPTAMVESLQRQFLAMGVPGERFVVEDFNLL